jgi:hypothetical protein
MYGGNLARSSRLRELDMNPGYEAVLALYVMAHLNAELYVAHRLKEAYKNKGFISSY